VVGVQRAELAGELAFGVGIFFFVVFFVFLIGAGRGLVLAAAIAIAIATAMIAALARSGESLVVGERALGADKRRGGDQGGAEEQRQRRLAHIEFHGSNPSFCLPGFGSVAMMWRICG
jgi:hypothetical protein